MCEHYYKIYLTYHSELDAMKDFNEASSSDHFQGFIPRRKKSRWATYPALSLPPSENAPSYNYGLLLERLHH